jgi:hypothetical protein
MEECAARVTVSVNKDGNVLVTFFMPPATMQHCFSAEGADKLARALLDAVDAARVTDNA